MDGCWELSPYVKLTGREEAYWRKTESSRRSPGSKVLRKGCVGNVQTHLENSKGNYVIRGNPVFSWDEAEDNAFEKKVPKLLGSRAGLPENIVQAGVKGESEGRVGGRTIRCSERKGELNHPEDEKFWKWRGRDAGHQQNQLVELTASGLQWKLWDDLVNMSPQTIVSNASGPPNCLRLIRIFKVDFMLKYVIEQML